jgi:5'-deoxynucleotidase YfbR-like HD superfamily hydrolase
MTEDRPPRFFEQDLRSLSFVERWGTVRRVTRQNVAEHSYFVAVYAGQIAEAIEWPGDRRTLYEYALAHDAPEVASGDIQGPTKRAAIDPERMAAFEAAESERRFGMSWIGGIIVMDSEINPEVKRIVKSADIMEEVMYLAMEMSLGNASVQDVLTKNVLPRARAAWMALPCDLEYLEMLWTTEVYPHILKVCECNTRHMITRSA